MAEPHRAHHLAALVLTRVAGRPGGEEHALGVQRGNDLLGAQARQRYRRDVRRPARWVTDDKCQRVGVANSANEAIDVTTSYPAAILGMSSTDFLMVAVAALLMAIAIAARTWVKTQEPAARAARLQKETMDAWKALPGNQDGIGAAHAAEEVIANQANQAP